ncbi:MAG: glycosyltransferase [Neisseria sp.]|nr:glycosyltransferase [Neisseria sp.]
MFLSVIIPVYNTKPEYIRECVESTQLLNGLCEYEVIAVDDGSSDADTLAYLKQLEETGGTENRFRFIRKANGGISSARNAGITAAQGQYIFPLDSDDKISKDVGKFIHHLKAHPEAEILHGDLSVFGDNEHIVKLGNCSKYELLFIQNTIPACSIYQKAVWQKVGGYDETFPTCEDWDFWCRCSVADTKFVYLPYANYHYRIVHNGASLAQSTADAMPLYHQKTLAKFPISAINTTEMEEFLNHTFHKQLRDKPRKSIAILLFSYWPKLFYWLCQKGAFSYKDQFISIP